MSTIRDKQKTNNQIINIGLLYNYLLKLLTSTSCIHVKNFYYQFKAVLFILFAYSKKLDTLCLILKVKADTYEVTAC